MRQIGGNLGFNFTLIKIPTQPSTSASLAHVFFLGVIPITYICYLSFVDPVAWFILVEMFKIPSSLFVHIRILYFLSTVFIKGEESFDDPSPIPSLLLTQL